MLDEAIAVIRELWKDENTNFEGEFYVVENARVDSMPEEPPPIYVAAAAENAAELAGRAGDGLISVAPNRDILERFDRAGGEGKPRYGQLHVCWAQDEADAVKTAHEVWPNSAIKGELGQELPLPRHFEQAAEMVSEDDIAQAVPCGPDPERHLEAIREYVDAGFDHVYVHQIGEDQEGFFRFFERDVLPKL